MSDSSNLELAKVRLERVYELCEEATALLNDGKYKSANNRAYYSVEKSIKALLALKKKDASTHSGVLKTFNMEYVHDGDGTFTVDDYRNADRAENIRSVSDYDDFYIANKDESEGQVESAKYLCNKVNNYILKQG